MNGSSEKRPFRTDSPILRNPVLRKRISKIPMGMTAVVLFSFAQCRIVDEAFIAGHDLIRHNIDVL